MKKSVFPSLLTTPLFLLTLLGSLVFGQATYGEEVAIVVSPSTLNIESEGVWVTIHAEIAYRDVDTVTVALNGIPVEVTKADSRGELVAKFCFDEVKEIVEVGTFDLTLSGTTYDGEAFFGADSIRVVRVSGK